MGVRDIVIVFYHHAHKSPHNVPKKKKAGGEPLFLHQPSTFSSIQNAGSFYCPVALSFTSCGLYAPEYVTVTTPVTAPVVVGVAFTRNVHCAPAARELLHGVPPPLAAEKSPLAT